MTITRVPANGPLGRHPATPPSSPAGSIQWVPGERSLPLRPSGTSPAGKRQRVPRLLFLQWGRNDPVGVSGIPPETPYRIGRGGEL